MAHPCPTGSSSELGALQLLFVHLGRFAQDLCAWTGFEVGHLHVPDAYVQVSSIMPQKRNPVAVEHLRLLCSLAAGRAGATRGRSEEHTSELQSLMRTSYAVFCLKKKTSQHA